MPTSKKYPAIDRSDYIPHTKKKDEDDHIDINLEEDVFSDGRAYRAESWAAYQMTFITYYFSVIEMENYTNQELKKYLIDEGVIEFDDEFYHAMGFEGINCSVGRITDKQGNLFWKVTIIIGDEDGVYVRFLEKPKTDKPAFDFQTEQNILHSYITDICDGIAESVKRHFIKDKSIASGDSGLINLWEEFCVQIQGDQSVVWNLYEDLFLDITNRKVNKLNENLKKLIWFWSEKSGGNETDENYNEDDVVDEIYNCICNKACNYNNKRIDDYLGL